MADLTMHPGIVANANPTVLTNGRPTAAILDPCTCGLHGMATIVGGHPSVLVGWRPIARILDPVACGAPPPVAYTPPQETRTDSPYGTTVKGHEGKLHTELKSDNGTEKMTIDYENGPYERTLERADFGGQGKVEQNEAKITINHTSDDGVFTRSDEVEIKGQGYEGDADFWSGSRRDRTGFGWVMKGGASGGSVKRTESRGIKVLGYEIGRRSSKGIGAGGGSGAGLGADYNPNTRRLSIRGEIPIPGADIELGDEFYVQAPVAETDKLPNFILTGSPDVFAG